MNFENKIHSLIRFEVYLLFRRGDIVWEIKIHHIKLIKQNRGM